MTEERHSKIARTESNLSLSPLVSFTDISKASFRCKSGVVRTTLRAAQQLSELCDVEIHLKFELHQRTGSFKERGARNRLLTLTEEEKKKRSCCCVCRKPCISNGISWKRTGHSCHSLYAIECAYYKGFKLSKMGANVLLFGDHLEEARTKAQEIMEKQGCVYVNGFDDPAIIAGAGTMGLEILEQLPQVEAIVLPIGGGGLIAGVSLAVKSIRPEILIIGVEALACPSFTKALEAGAPVKVNVSPSLADGLNVSQVGANAFAVARSLVDHVVTVTETEVALAVLKLVEVEKCVTEGAGAIGLAAIMAGKLPMLKGLKVVVPLCGGNIDPGTLGNVIQHGMAADGRLFRFEASISDRPGGLASFTQMLASTGASVKDITHDRTFHFQPMRVCVQCVVETRDKAHAEAVRQRLSEDDSIHVKFFEAPQQH